jgi:uncharacterized protein involved in propanediol utilization
MATSRDIEIRSKHGVRTLMRGVGKCSAQYGELFQGQISSDNDQYHRCLMSLPCRELVSTVVFDPCPVQPLHVLPAHKQKSLNVVELTLAYCGEESIGGHITVTSNIPEAKGCGSSTADCVAAVIATARAINRVLTEAEVAKLVVQAEVASDNLMFSRAILFAHREGIILTDYGKDIPSLEVLGIDTADEMVVDTLEFSPAVYTRDQIATFEGLTKVLHTAIVNDDLGLLGEVATASACINQAFLPKPMFGEILQIVKHTSALGVAVAHSGTVLAILLDPRHEALEQQVESIETELSKLGVSKKLRYST